MFDATFARLARATPMDVNWLDLFQAADRFLVAIVERNVVLVYVTLFLIFFSETGLVVMCRRCRPRRPRD